MQTSPTTSCQEPVLSSMLFLSLQSTLLHSPPTKALLCILGLAPRPNLMSMCYKLSPNFPKAHIITADVMHPQHFACTSGGISFILDHTRIISS